MKLLNFTIASVVDATTGSHLAQTPYSGHRPENENAQVAQNRSGSSKLLSNGFKAVSRLANEWADAYKRRSLRRKDTAEILRLSAHNLKDIGLTYHDLEGLRSGQISLEALNVMRTDNLGHFNRRPISPKISRIKAPQLSAANQNDCELASCG